MIFALADYLQYRLRIGRFGDHQKDGALGSFGFLNGIPEDVLEQIEDADIIFTQKLDSPLSWSVMYFGSSPVDHMGICSGQGTVIHATLYGVREHSIKALAKNARVFFVKDMASVISDSIKSPNGGVLSRRDRWFHGFPPKIQLALGAVEIILGFYPASFRWWFFADVLIVCGIMDVVIFGLWHIFVALPIAAALGFILIFNMAKYAYLRVAGKPYELLSHPDLGLRSFYRHGGRMITKLGTFVLCEYGILPLKVFVAIREELGLSGEGADNGADDDLQETRELGGDGAKDGNSERAFRTAEDQNGDERDDQQIEEGSDDPR